MIKYTKQDKDNNDIIVEIKPDRLLPEYVNCKIYSILYINLFIVKLNWCNEVYSDTKRIDKVDGYSCEDYEAWTDESIRFYNHRLIRIEKENRTKEFINNGCK